MFKKLMLALVLMSNASFVLADTFDTRLGAAYRVTEYGGNRYYYRIPVIYTHRGVHREIGYIDMNADFVVTRRSVLSVTTENDLKNLRQQTTEMNYGQVVEHARRFLGYNADVINPPVLMYDATETKIMWFVKMKYDGKEFILAITPSFTYKLQ